MIPAELLLSEARAAGVLILPAADGGATVRFTGDRPVELLERMRPFRVAVVALAHGRRPEQCAGCELHPIADPGPELLELAAGCGHRDCPHRQGPPPDPARVERIALQFLAPAPASAAA